MCRLGVFSGIQETLPISWAFTELELSMGGHGNGLYLASNDTVYKGTNKTPIELAKKASKEDDICMFHTRLASCGGIRDHLCHPFDVSGDEGKYVVMHNGHWTDWRQYATYTDNNSDTQTMAKMVAKHGIGVLGSWEARNSGVWVVYDKTEKKCFVIRRSGTFFLQRLKEADETDPPVFFHASEPLFSLAGWRRGSGQIKPDTFYELRNSGRAKERNGIAAVKPERAPVRSTTGGYYGSNGSSAPGGYGSMGQFLHDRAYGYDGSHWNCYCKRSGSVCKECRDHQQQYDTMPLYTEDKEWYDTLTYVDRICLGIPPELEIGGKAPWAQASTTTNSGTTTKGTSNHPTTESRPHVPTSPPPTSSSTSASTAPKTNGHKKGVAESLSDADFLALDEASQNRVLNSLTGSAECFNEGCTNLTWFMYCDECLLEDAEEYEGGEYDPYLLDPASSHSVYVNGECSLCQEEVFIPLAKLGSYICNSCKGAALEGMFGV